jgi:putative addiction module killer protein
MAGTKLVEYLSHGVSPFRTWFSGLDAFAAAKVATALYRLEQGNFSNVKAVGKGVSEHRIDFGPGYRIYFGQEGGKVIILLGGGSKKTQRKDIRAAQALWAEYKSSKGDWGEYMAITRKFRETILLRVESDPEFRTQLLTEAVNELLAGDLNAGKAMLRDYINATITFRNLAKKLKKPDKSVHRMLGPRGNPRADNIIEIIKILQAYEHVKLRVEAQKTAA